MLKLFRFKKSEQQMQSLCDGNYQTAQVSSQSSSLPQHLYFMWEQHNITILKVDILLIKSK